MVLKRFAEETGKVRFFYNPQVEMVLITAMKNPTDSPCP
jgi:hypothetical protein